MNRGDGLALGTLYALALAARLVPLLLSPLPYNIDGFGQVHIAQRLAAGGHWSLTLDPSAAYNLKMPILPLLLEEASLLLGVNPLWLAQPLIALVGATAVPATYALARSLGLHRGGAVASGAFLALGGTFVFLTGSTMKEALGLALLPVALLLFVGRGQARRGLGILLLALLPFVHSLTTAMAIAFVAAIIVQAHASTYRRGAFQPRRAAADGIMVGLLALLPLVYYSAVHLEYFSDLVDGEDIALLLSVAFVCLLLILGVAGRRQGRMSRAPGRALLNPPAALALAAVAVVWFNHRRPLFAGTAPTPSLLLVVALAHLPLVALAIVGMGRARSSPERLRSALLALLAVPAAAGAFAVLRGLDPVSFILVYRSYDFLDFGLALALGLGAVRPPKPLGPRAVGGLLVACLLLTLPAAYATEATFGVRNATSPAEFAALGRFAALQGALGTDQRCGDILAAYWGRASDRMVPLDLQAGRTPNATYLLVEEDWSTAGAQVFPLPRAIVPPARLEGLLQGGDLIYANSGGMIVIRVGPPVAPSPGADTRVG